MKKAVLIVNSSNRVNKILTGFLETLSEKDFSFVLASSKKPLIDFWKKNNWPFSRIILGPYRNKKAKNILFLLLLPFLYFINFFVFIFFRVKFAPQIIICLSLPEKIIYTPLASVFKLRVIWAEDPINNYQKENALLKYLLKKLSAQAKIMVFLPSSKLKLQRFGLKGEINIVSPGVKEMKSQHQDNIFSNLASRKGEGWNRQKKYFTVGLVTDFKNPNQLDNLFRAASICLNVVSNLQIIVVGEGEDRKQVMWNNKKIGLENLTWFVGRQDNLKKWLDSFDVYVAVSEEPHDLNLKLILKAMSVFLPIISFSGNGQEDLIESGQNGIVCEPGDPETLSQAILKLYNNKNYRKKLGFQAGEDVRNNFSIIKQAQEFAKILEE